MITGAQLSTAAAAGSVVQGDLCKNQCEHKNTHNLVKDTKTFEKKNTEDCPCNAAVTFQ